MAGTKEPGSMTREMVMVHTGSLRPRHVRGCAVRDREDALSIMPPEAVTTITDAGPRLYTDYAERVYGTRTPPLGTTLTTHA